jgi:glycosyltransferase involved in cell wall biosynthesis
VIPTFDVVVPCHNYARFLERCVTSALSQEGAHVRVLIIDDCSSDDTPLVGQRLASGDARVEFRRHEKNHGHIATYNEGLLGWAKADYSLLLSADDALVPGAFQRALRLFDTSADVGVVFGMARIITHDDESQFPPENEFTSAQIVPGEDFIRYCCERCVNPVPTATAIVRTAWQHRLGGYRSDLPHTGDFEMWMRFALSGSIGAIRSIQGEYRRHSDNMSAKYYIRLLGDRREFAFTCRETLTPILTTNPDAHSWLATVHSNLFSHAEQNAAVAFEYGDLARYQAWSTFAREILQYLDSPRWSRRLAIRDFLGQHWWLLLRSAQRTLTGRVPESRPLDVCWSPSHGEIIGWWPELPARS